MKIIAAMSGGVDSAVAAARAVEAGHEVIGVHLALASNPQKYRSGARGCCTIEDSHDARRAADKVIFMDHGRIVESAAPEAFFRSPQTARCKEFLGRILHH